MAEAYLYGQGGGGGLKRATGVVTGTNKYELTVTGLGFKPTQIRVYYYSPDYRYACVINGSLAWALYDNGVVKNCVGISGDGGDVDFDSSSISITPQDDGFQVTNSSSYANLNSPNYFYYEAWEE